MKRQQRDTERIDRRRAALDRNEKQTLRASSAPCSGDCEAGGWMAVCGCDVTSS